MRTSTKLLLTGAGALAVAGVAIAANHSHVMEVALPDGSVAQIRYVGNVPPKVEVAPAHEMAPSAMLDDSPAPTLNQIAARDATPASRAILLVKAGQPAASEAGGDTI